MGRRAGRAGEPPAEQHESGDWLRARRHRSDRSRRRAGVDRFDLPLVLGLEPKDFAMPALTFVVSAINASCESVAQTFLSV